MEALKARFKVLAERIDAMSVRERGAIFFAVVLVLAVIAHSVVFDPLRKRQRGLEQEFKTKQEQTRAADLQVSTLFSVDGKDINADNRAKVAALKQQIAEFDTRMDRMTTGVVSPKDMARLMEQMLLRTRGLELVRLEALPPMPIDAEQKPVGALEAKTANDVMVYRHGMRIELKGRYFDIVEYLKALEGLSWKVFWGEVSLETDKYPVSKVSLVIYTLSRHSGWIGV